MLLSGQAADQCQLDLQRQQYPGFERHDHLNYSNNCLWPLLPELDMQLRAALTSGDNDAAITACIHCIAAIATQNAVLVLALSTLKARIGEPVTFKEIKRCAGQKNDIIARRSDSQRKRDEVRKAFAKYTPEDIAARGVTRIHKEIGKTVAERLDLPKNISRSAVRGYLEEILGNG